MPNHDFEQDQADMPEKVLQALMVLSDAGYAVAAFSPEELSGASPSSVEGLMIERGWEAIESLTS